MSIENEKLRLIPHRVRTDQDGEIVIEPPDSVMIALPTEYRDFYRLSCEGLSIAQLARGLRLTQANGRFAYLFRYLCFMADHGLLADKRLVRLIEASRPDYRWNESIACEELFGMEVFRFPKIQPPKWLGMPVALGMANGGLFLWVYLSDAMTETRFQAALGDRTTAVPLLIAFATAFCLGRSLRALLQALGAWITTGQEVSLRLRLDPVSLSLATDDLSRLRSERPLMGIGMGAFLMSVALTLLSVRWLEFPVSPALLTYFLCLLLLADSTPFARSAGTEWLRFVYNFKARLFEGKPGAPDVEASIWRDHVIFSFVWCGLLALFLVSVSANLVRALWPVIDLRTGAGLVSAGALLLLQALIWFSLLDDAASAIRYGDGDRRLVRRLFRRKGPRLAVDEAIRQGRSPSLEELAKLPFLRQLDPVLRAELIARSRWIDVTEGNAVCRQGGNDRSLFIVLAGRLAVARSRRGSRRRVVAWLDPGAVFGEAAFFFGSARTADVVAMEESRLLEIRHDNTMKSLSSDSFDEMRLRIWLLQAIASSPTFRELPSEAVDALVFAGQKREFKAGDTVIHEGDDADACYFIVQGQASALQNGRLINKMKAGDAFGEIALLRPLSPRTASVTADSDLLTVMIPSESFWDLISSHLPLAIEIERLAEGRLQNDRTRHSARGSTQHPSHQSSGSSTGSSSSRRVS